MAVLWVNAETKAYWDELTEQRTHNEAMHKVYASQTSPFEKDCERLLYLIATGYADDAGEIAKKIATDVYNNRLDRCFCEHTGFPYFHECYDGY